MAYLWVAIGGALGSVGRYAFGLMAARLWGEAFPWGTIAINIMGSFVIGFFGTLTLPEGAMPASPSLRTFVMVGICGGFTTFSSFSLQTLTLARDGNWFGAMGNIMLSVVLCLLAVTAGHVSADRIGLARQEAGMGLHKIVAALDSARAAPPVLTAAALAGARLAPARIEVLHIRHDALEGFMPTEDVMTDARRQELDGRAAQRSAALRAVFDVWQPAYGNAVWREVTGETPLVLAGEAAGADLLVLALPAESGTMRQVLHAALFDLRLPTLLVPDSVPPVLGRHVAVAWKPSAAAERAVSAAMRLLAGAERVTVLTGVGDADAEAAPCPLLAHLRNVDSIRFETGPLGIGAALLAEAHRVGADLLVMGAYTHSRLAELVLGGATRHMLGHADLPVLLRH
jgi:protein CrcB